MQRNIITDALILSVSQLGENNRSVCMLTPSEGISYAVLYGGPKSKLKGLVSPFCSGKIYLYCDNVKKSTKITDFDVKNFHLSFRESLFKSWAASLSAELALKTKCAGSPQDCWILLNGFLDGLELTDEPNGKLGLIRFLWRYLGLLGVRPDTKYCGVCDKGLLSESTECNRFLFDAAENKFICQSCAGIAGTGTGNSTDGQNMSRGASFALSKQALEYLNAVSEKTPKEVRAITCTAQTVNELKQLVFYLIEASAGQKLKTLESGLGIL